MPRPTTGQYYERSSPDIQYDTITFNTPGQMQNHPPDEEQHTVRSNADTPTSYTATSSNVYYFMSSIMEGNRIGTAVVAGPQNPLFFDVISEVRNSAPTLVSYTGEENAAYSCLCNSQASKLASMIALLPVEVVIRTIFLLIKKYIGVIGPHLRSLIEDQVEFSNLIGARIPRSSGAAEFVSDMSEVSRILSRTAGDPGTCRHLEFLNSGWMVDSRHEDAIRREIISVRSNVYRRRLVSNQITV